MKITVAYRQANANCNVLYYVVLIKINNLNETEKESKSKLLSSSIKKLHIIFTVKLTTESKVKQNKTKRKYSFNTIYDIML